MSYGLMRTDQTKQLQQLKKRKEKKKKKTTVWEGGVGRRGEL